MTPDQQFTIALTTLVISAILSLAGIIANLIRTNQAIAQSAAAQQVAEAGIAVSLANGKKSDEANGKLVEIHTLTNSNLSNVTKALEVAMEKISGLEKMVYSMDQARVNAEMVAKNLASTRPSRATDPAIPGPMPVQIVGATEPVPVEVISHADESKK